MDRETNSNLPENNQTSAGPAEENAPFPKRVLLGIVPAIFMAVIPSIATLFEDQTSLDFPYSMPSLGLLILVTPIYLVFWAYFYMHAHLGPAGSGQKLNRFVEVAMATILMSIINVGAGIGGCLFCGVTFQGVISLE